MLKSRPPLPEDQSTVGGVVTGSGNINRNTTLPKPSIRENMILQRQNYTKPLTAKA